MDSLIARLYRPAGNSSEMYDNDIVLINKGIARERERESERERTKQGSEIKRVSIKVK